MMSLINNGTLTVRAATDGELAALIKTQLIETSFFVSRRWFGEVILSLFDRPFLVVLYAVVKRNRHSLFLPSSHIW